MNVTWIGWGALALVAAGCGASGTAAGDAGTTEPDAGAGLGGDLDGGDLDGGDLDGGDLEPEAGTEPDSSGGDVGDGDGAKGDPEPEWTGGTLEVGAGASGLTVTDRWVAWAEEGDIWLHDLEAGTTKRIVEHPATQKEPVLSGDLLVWADDRGGDFDLWRTDVLEGGEGPLVTGPGDQDSPSLDGADLVFLGRNEAPHSALEAEVYHLDFAAGAAVVQLTSDEVEQAYPHVKGGRAVWTDFAMDPDGQYVDLPNPAENNGDIVGFDLVAGVPFEVTRNEAKQLRPAVDGTAVAWLDWRGLTPGGISPEPKYSEFKVFAMDLAEGVERELALSSWTAPDLWRRPAVDGGVVVFVEQLSPVEAETVETGLFASPLTGEGKSLLASVQGSILAVDLTPDVVGWLGDGTLGLLPAPVP